MEKRKIVKHCSTYSNFNTKLGILKYLFIELSKVKLHFRVHNILMSP